MRKDLVFLSFFILFFVRFQAQEPNDCVGAITVCGNGNFMSNATGAGAIDEVSSCSGFEHNSLWLRIDIVQSGTLGFDLIPNNPDILVDYDFWVYGPNRLCSNLGTPIRCATTNPNEAGLPNNHTGINGSTTLTQTGPGANGNGYVYWLNVTVGEFYYIAIDRPEGDGGFEIQWTGTATNGTGAFPTPPAANSIDDLVQCSSTPDIGVFDLASVINDINPDIVNNTVGFYANLADATDAVNPLPYIYANTSNPQQIYARVTSASTDCYDLVDFNLIVSSIPDAIVTVSPTSVCEGENVTFALSGTPNATVHYSLNGGAIQDIVLDATGMADVNLAPLVDTTMNLEDAQVLNSGGTIICSQSLSDSATVIVNADPVVGLNTNSPICSGEDAEFTITGTSGDIVDYNLNGGTTQQITIDTTGQAMVTVSGATSDQVINLLLVTNPTTGCNSTLMDSATITVYPTPTVSLSSNSPICSGEDAEFIITGTSGYIVDYNLNGGANQQVTIDATGQAVVTVPSATMDQVINLLLVSNPAAGCNSTLMDTDTVIVNSNPTVSLSSNGPICSGEDVEFTLTGTSGVVVDFNLNGGTTQQVIVNGQTVITVSGATSDQEINLLLVTNSTTGCASTLMDTATVIVNPNPIVSLDSNSPICSGEDAEFIITGTSGDIVDYNLNGGVTQQVTLDAAGQAVITVPGASSTQTINLEVITNVSTTCTTVASESLSLLVNPLPTITDPTPLVSCDDAVQDGLTSIDLHQKDDQITGGNLDYMVSYYLSQASADAGAPGLSSPYTNVSNPQTVYVRVEDLNTGCYTTTTLELSVVSSIAVNPPSDLTFCDPDNDGFGVFDLESATQEITGGDPDLAVTYHETLTNAEMGISALSSPYTNIVNSDLGQTIWVRVENVTTATDCPTIITMQLIVNDTPTIEDPEPYYVCDDDDDGIAIFDLSSYNDIILNGLTAPDYSIAYYLNQTDAETPDNAIANTSNYTNITNPQIVYVRVENTITNCYTLTTLELNVNSLPLAIQPEPLRLCDDEVADEVTVFDLTVKNDEITAGNSQSVFVGYYETLAEAESGTNAIDPATAYTNTSINGNSHNPQTLWVRVEDTQTGCFALTTLTIEVLPNPTPTPSSGLQDLSTCDVTNPGDMTEVFDLTFQEDLILNSEPGVTPTYYTSMEDAEAGANAISDPTAFSNTSSTQTIYVRVTNDLTGCYTIVDFDIIVYPPPPSILEPLYTLCIDTNGTEVVGAPILDTGLSIPDYSFEWSYEGSIIAGATNGYYEATQSGIYSVVITSIAAQCTLEQTTTVNEASPPTIEAQVTSTAFAENHIIEVSAIGTGADSVFEYSLDNGSWQTSNIFDEVSPGGHLVRVREINGCGEASVEVSVIDYPPYFTPNGDGYHDRWRIRGMDNQTNAKVFIYDRYGKLLAQISPSGPGWDGTYRGDYLPSSDYWFVITYEELGQTKEFKSHFTLKR